MWQSFGLIACHGSVTYHCFNIQKFITLNFFSFLLTALIVEISNYLNTSSALSYYINFFILFLALKNIIKTLFLYLQKR